MTNYLILAGRKICNRLFLQFILVCAVLSFSLTKLHAQTPILLEKHILEEGMDNTEYLQTLLYDNVPAILISKNGIQELRTGYPQRASVDASDLNIISNSEVSFRSIKLLQINLTKEEDKFNIRLTPELLNNFFNLYYVFIHSTVPLTQSEVAVMTTGFDEGQIVFLFSVNTIM